MDKAYAKRYFITWHGRQAGPFTKEQLRGMGVAPDTRIWNEDVFDWVRADTFTELKEVLAEPDPAVRPQGLFNWLLRTQKHHS